VLQVRNLSVEVGARKTSLFKVLGGAAEPKAGTITRAGAFGYLPQDPRIAGGFDDRSAVSLKRVVPRQSAAF
jgi:ATPase subunit of ABC transporter with duplicated ATPase domains